ncbi:uncharacterized protein N7529_000229 [Penicillium soppii]|uniref:uncharacterized protein n=1 Tax=Penicillium soppii TaxID=69789 RepID=UPI0025494250|nr:uncharacterized protein N7529_000229 [Penicillium soppii]KAJ5881557.1 hypothetical protein N7529_000229 [Penicillium soppii]
MASISPKSGYVGSLTESEGQKLRAFWRILMQSWNANTATPEEAAEKVKSNDSAKGHRRFFSLGRALEPKLSEEETSAIPSNLLTTLNSLDAGPAELKTIQSLMLKLPGDKLRSALLTLLKQDHPDALLLRFLRAVKWNLPKAWIKLVAALNWRVNEYKVDEEVLLKGEAHAVDKSQQDGDSPEKKYGEGFILQATSGKGHFHGCDRWNRPIGIVRVRKHDPSAQTQKALNDYIVQCIETVRLLQVPPVETMAIVFDLTSFALGNWELAAISFILHAFQEYYPESLGAMIFYNAPLIFAGLWRLVQGSLDPVVAAKVHFISSAKALEEIIPREQILKELGGEEDWEYEYIEPAPNENAKLNDIATRDDILAKREKLGDELFTLTAEWIVDSKTKSLPRRNEVIEELRRNYWDLDPYVRARTVLDRTGVIKGDGTVDFYPAAKPKNEPTEKQLIVPEVGTTTQTPVAAS